MSEKQTRFPDIVDPDVITDRIAGPFNEAALRQVAGWYAHAGAQIEALSDLILRLARQLRVDAMPDDDTIQTRLTDLRAFMEAFAPPPRRLDEEGGFREAWQAAMKPMDALSREGRILLDRELLRIKPGDDPVLRMRRLLLQVILFAESIQYRAVALARRLLRRKFRAPYQPLRTLRIDRFLRTFLVIPANQTLLSSWLEFNRFMSGLMHDFEQALDEAVRPDARVEGNSLAPLITLLAELQTRPKGAGEAAAEALHKSLASVSDAAKAAMRAAGTPIFPGIRFTKRAFVRKRGKYQRLLSRAQSVWIRMWDGIVSEWMKDVDLSAAAWSAMALAHAIIRHKERALLDSVSAGMDEIAEALRRENDALQSGDRIRKTTAREKIIRNFCDAAIPELIDRFIDADPESLFEDIGAEFEESLGLIRPEYVLLRRSAADTTLPKVGTETIPMCEVIRNHAADAFLVRMGALREEMRAETLALTNELSALSDVLLYAFESAEDAGALEESQSSWQDMVRDGIDRTCARIEALKTDLTDFIARYGLKAQEAAADYAERVNELRQTDKLFAVQLALTQARARRRLREAARLAGRRVRSATTVVRRVAGRRLRSLSAGAEGVFARLLAASRLGKGADASGGDIIPFLRETEQHIRTLPAIYRRLFRFAPLSASKLFVGREAELATLRQSMQTWRAHRTGMIAVTGERGSGKTSFLQQFASESGGAVEIKQIECRETARSESDLLALLKGALGCMDCKTLEQLESVVAASEKREICIVEDLHYLFLKTIPSMALMRRLLLFLKFTEKRIFWIISCGRYAWDFLDKSIGIAGDFSRIIRIDAFSDEALKALALNRHRLSGIALKFIPDRQMRRMKAYRKLGSEHQRQEWLAQRYFENLHRVSGGNLASAMLFWLRSISPRDDGFQIPASLMLETGFLFDLRSEDQFLLAAIVQHGRLTIGECAEVFIESAQTAMEMLTRLENRGLLYLNDDYYEIHFFLYKPLVRLLYERRYLH